MFIYISRKSITNTLILFGMKIETFEKSIIWVIVLFVITQDSKKGISFYCSYVYICIYSYVFGCCNGVYSA